MLIAAASTRPPPSISTVHRDPFTDRTTPISRLFSPMNWATKAFSGSSYSTEGDASCWIAPSLKTAIRFDIVSASPWSWVT